MEDVTNPNSGNFIRPEDRIATFDMDGTFVGELYPTYFEYNILEYRALDDPTYKDKAPADVREAAQDIRDFVRNGKKLPSQFDMKHAYAAAKAYAGMTISEFDAYVKKYAATPANGFKGMTYGQSFYKPMLEVFEYLKDNGFTFYVVSGSDRFSVFPFRRQVVYRWLTYLCSVWRTAPLPANSSRTMPSICSPRPAS